MGVAAAIGIGMFVTSVVATIGVAAGEEAAECNKVNQQLDESTDHFKQVIQSLSKFDDDLEQNQGQIANYLKSITSELKNLKNTYSETQKSMSTKYGEMQLLLIFGLSFFIALLTIRYINATKLK
tara:strand:- start:281 stop:655 length:375 start_codon:yes stop_codon:yes gene_type:complete